MYFAYCNWDNYYWGYGSRSRNVTSGAKTIYDEYLDDIIYYAKSVGVEEETIKELLDAGYDYMDIEDMLYDYDYYRQDNFCDEI